MEQNLCLWNDSTFFHKAKSWRKIKFYIITYGVISGEVTEQWMGVNELLLGTAIFGLMFALFAAQPLTIIGATGPILIFEGGLFQVTCFFFFQIQIQICFIASM